MPLAPDVMLSQPAELVDDQLQPPWAVTATEPVDAAAVRDAEPGASEYAQAAPACVSVKVSPATVSVAVRGDVEGFAVARYAIVPSPLPLAPDVTVSQLAELLTDQAQPARAVTATEPVESAAPADAVAGLSE